MAEALMARTPEGGSVDAASPRWRTELTAEAILNDDALLSRLVKRVAKADVCHHMRPFCFLPPWPMGSRFLHYCRLGVFQYVLIKLVCAILTCILESQELYDEGDFHAFDRGYIWVTLLVNFSQILAMYCLVLFWHEMQDALLGVRPVAKLLVIKAIVFVSWWQGVGIAGFVWLGWIRGTLTYSVQEVASGLQDFLICIEMLFAAVAHHFIFSYHDMYDASAENAASILANRKSPIKAMTDVLPVDVIRAVPRFLGPRQASVAALGDDTRSDRPRPGSEAGATPSGRRDSDGTNARATNGAGAAGTGVAGASGREGGGVIAVTPPGSYGTTDTTNPVVAASSAGHRGSIVQA